MRSLEPWTSCDSLVWGFGDRFSVPPVATIRVRQVHGCDVILCDKLSPGENAAIEGDGLVTTRPGVFVAVKTADCVPILMVASSKSDARWVAAVHAGWRGTAANIVVASVRDAGARGHALTDLRVLIGPAIRGCCYEVDEDVASRFRRADLPVIEGSRKPRLDLPQINREQLVRAGLPAQNVEIAVVACTRCESGRYHSYRAAPAEGGRQLSWIGWRT